jgi:hypothetical protein
LQPHRRGQVAPRYSGLPAIGPGHEPIDVLLAWGCARRHAPARSAPARSAASGGGRERDDERNEPAHDVGLSDGWRDQEILSTREGAKCQRCPGLSGRTCGGVSISASAPRPRAPGQHASGSAALINSRPANTKGYGAKLTPFASV